MGQQKRRSGITPQIEPRISVEFHCGVLGGMQSIRGLDMGNTPTSWNREGPRASRRAC
jgi:hypothetical protein